MKVTNKFLISLFGTILFISILACGSSDSSSGGSPPPPPPPPPDPVVTTTCGTTGLYCENEAESCIFGEDQACGANGATGECQVRPALSSCSNMGNVVCGCDGRTYTSACHARHYGISVETQGECPEDHHLLLDCRDAANWPFAWRAVEKEIVAEINRHRAQGATCRGVAFAPAHPVVMDSSLQQAARCHSLDMGTRNYFAHNTPEGLNHYQRVAATNYAHSVHGEVLAAGQRLAEQVVHGWIHSQTGHCEIVMRANSNQVGVGYAYAETGTSKTYWTANFGRNP